MQPQVVLSLNISSPFQFVPGGLIYWANLSAHVIQHGIDFRQLSLHVFYFMQTFMNFLLKVA